MRRRCAWCTNDPLYIDYHDREWGVPQYGQRRLFELLVLEGAQAGLSWLTILRKREGYRRAFAGFDPRALAAIDDDRLEALLRDPSIVRNRLKVLAARDNARALLAMEAAGVDFAAHLWSFVNGEPLVNHWRSLAEVPSSTPVSEAMSRDLRRRGFRFVGPTICYALMQAAGLVMDHTTDCFRHPELAGR